MFKQDKGKDLEQHKSCWHNQCRGSNQRCAFNYCHPARKVLTCTFLFGCISQQGSWEQDSGGKASINLTKTHTGLLKATRPRGSTLKKKKVIRAAACHIGHIFAKKAVFQFGCPCFIIFFIHSSEVLQSFTMCLCIYDESNFSLSSSVNTVELYVWWFMMAAFQ